jgi:glycerate kinase
VKIVLAPDKFKGCLSAEEVARHMAAGARRADPSAQLDLCPLADGGEGTVRALVAATGGKLLTRRVTGPLEDMTVQAEFGLLGDGKTAVVEMAAASGLALLPPELRNPLNTTTYGTGELLLAAAELDVQHILLGIGGSATCDAGIGCCQAVGLPVLMKTGEPAPRHEPLCARDLPKVALIKRGRGSKLDRIHITVACDVDNPLFGPRGAAPVFAPQKGASPEEVRWLDTELQNLARRCNALDTAQHPGAGAAGGLGWAMLAFFNAELRPGIDLLIQATHLRQRLADADLVLTGEGRLDASSLGGKTTIGIARLCQEMRIPCIALAGSVREIGPEAHEQGLTAWFAIGDEPMKPEESLARAGELIESAAENVIRTFRTGFISRQAPNGER